MRKRAHAKGKRCQQFMTGKEHDRQRSLGTIGKRKFETVLADPPWRFVNRTGKIAPEHPRLSRYGTMSREIELRHCLFRRF